MSEVVIDSKSENYKEGGPEGARFALTLTFNTPEAAPEPGKEKEKPTGSEDLLRIRFRHSRPVPEEVKDYISSNLGIFELTEEGDAKTLTFELKINDINIELIHTVYQKFFAGPLKQTRVALSYDRRQSLDDWAGELREYSQVPLLLHALECAHLRLEASHGVEVLKALFEFIRAEKAPLIEPWMDLALTLLSLRAKGELRSFKKLDLGVFKELEFDQRDNFQSFIYPFDNPINNYIFEEDQPGELEVSGRILNILNYEFKGRFPGLRGFIEKALSM